MHSFWKAHINLNRQMTNVPRCGGALPADAIESGPYSSAQMRMINRGSLYGWFAADEIEGLNDGDNLAFWPSVAAIPNIALQMTEGDKPSYGTNRCNGLPAVCFDGTEYLSVQMPQMFRGIGGGTIMAVVRQTAWVGAARSVVIAYTNTTTARLSLSSEYTAAGKKYYGGGRRNDADSYSAVLGQESRLDEWFILTVIADWANADFFFRQNGKQRANTSWQTAGTTPDTDSVGICIGGAGTTGFIGEIAEVMMWSKALTPPEIADAEQYLSAKYGIALGSGSLTTTSTTTTTTTTSSSTTTTTTGA